MRIIGPEDARELFHNRNLMEDVVGQLINEPAVVASLAAEASDELGDVLGESPEFRRKVLAGVAAHANFQRLLVGKLVEEVLDD